jgi:regulatory protein
MDYAMRSLSRRAHTELEIRQKLQKRPHHTEAHENKIVARLIDLNLINDQAYIDRQLEMAANVNYQGPYRAAQRMKKRGITLEQVKERWSVLKLNEEEIAKKALKKLEKKLERIPKEKHYDKRAQFLSSRGFSAPIVFELAKTDDHM